VVVPGEHTRCYERVAREYGCYIQTGSFIEIDERHPDILFNTTLLIGPEGKRRPPLAAKRTPPAAKRSDAGTPKRQQSFFSRETQPPATRTGETGTLYLNNGPGVVKAPAARTDVTTFLDQSLSMTSARDRTCAKQLVDATMVQPPFIPVMESRQPHSPDVGGSFITKFQIRVLDKSGSGLSGSSRPSPQLSWRTDPGEVA
jgi:hypothetical protein